MRIFRTFRKRQQEPAAKNDIEPWIEALKHVDANIRSAAAEELAKKGEAAVPLLIEALEDKHSGVRAGVAYALGHIGDTRAVEPLIRRLQDENENVRAVVVPALRRIGDARAVEPLTGTLKDPYTAARSQAAHALAKFDDPRAVPALIQALGDEDNDVRYTAALALAKIGDTRAVEPLIGRLTSKEDDAQVQLVAVIGLGDLGDPRATVPLTRVLEVGDGAFRSAAAEALGKIGDTGAVEPLIQAMSDEDVSVRRLAARSLGQLGDGRAVPSLRQALQDEDEEVRAEAQEALAMLAAQGKEPEAVRAEQPVPAPPGKGEAPTFVGESQKGKNKYEEYEAADAESAKAFLLKKKVDKPHYYITVETPEGIWGTDKEGLFLVRLLPWQTDLSLAQCQGSIAERPTVFSLQAAVQIAGVDNFVASVKCGNCGHEWLDGLRYQDVTVVRCPHCRNYNKVNSNLIQATTG